MTSLPHSHHMSAKLKVRACVRPGQYLQHTAFSLSFSSQWAHSFFNLSCHFFISSRLPFHLTKIHPVLRCQIIALHSINYYPSPVSFISSSLPVLSRFNTTITVIILTHLPYISKDHSLPCPLFYHYTTGIFNSKGLSMSLHGLQGLDSKIPDARSLINSLASLIEKSDVSTVM